MDTLKDNNYTHTDFSSFKKHLNQFAQLNDTEYLIVQDDLKVKKLQKHQVLVRENEPVRFTYWVNRGLLTSTLVDKAGKEHIIQFAIENCWITDQNAYYNQEIATFRITALEDSEVFALSFDAREKLCSEIPEMAQFFRKKANDSFIKQQKRLVTYLTANAKERFDLLIQEFPTLLQRISKKRLAAYLGVARETLSRLT